jgi:CHAT domain-containing protein/tetratricopeptide (TPR) repeat protein
MIRLPATPAIAACLAVCFAASAPAGAQSLKLADSFRIGSSGVLCTAQSRIADPGLQTMFDRGYRIVCRDAATPVGKLFALRTAGGDRTAALLGQRADNVKCQAPTAGDIRELPAARVARCTDGSLAWLVYTLAIGDTLYAAEGLSGYASALQLGLRALVADRAVMGEVQVAATEAGDPAAFARIQAGSLDPSQALSEGYARNNAGSFAEASEFFDLLVERNRQGRPGFNRSAEYLANQALQQSNLGRFPEADALFARAGAVLDADDPVVTRLYRNFRAMHELNRRRPDAALLELRRAATVDISGLDKTRVLQGYIDRPLAQKLNSDDAMRGLSGVDSHLTPMERAAILDAQGEYLKGAALRMQGRDADSRAALSAAVGQLDAMQNRAASAGWLKAGAATELAIIQERAGQRAAALASLTFAADVYRVEYPDSAIYLVARAQLAALLARQGKAAESAAIYREVIKASPTTPGAGLALRIIVGPYFALLVGNAPTATGAASDFFDASQILVRPGVAQTQAVLARELSGGSDAASGLFRTSLTLSRDIVRADAEISQLAAKPEATPADAGILQGLRAQRETLAGEQTAVLARLSEFPRYRSISDGTVTLAALQAKLLPGEAYYKLILIGEDGYALFATANTANIFKVGVSTSELGSMVSGLRDTIVKFENGRPATYPFDALLARKLYKALFQPVDAAMPKVRHLVFEPDGPMLQLPANLLITSDAGLEAYEARANSPDGDPFDMRGIAWLGRDRMVSTAVSPRAFLDVRGFAPSKATRSYLGLGENAIPAGVGADAVVAAPVLKGRVAATRGGEMNMTPLPSRDPCDWPLSEWGSPISPAELLIGAKLIGGNTAKVLTGAAFSDTALKSMPDLRDFRVIHFATHGLVTAPRPECPARPALLTSFGGGDSDGLLSFREIFDLNLDADTIILSACDTAGTATAAATRDAGVATGGNYALDGLVRAFVGAGARAVIASHWPVPDNYDATKTLITGLFSDPGKMSVGEALRRSEVRLMDALDTSHPYYWSGFAIVGDAAKTLEGTSPAATANSGANTVANGGQ